MLSSSLRAGLRTPASVARAFRRGHTHSISRSPVVNLPTNNLALSQADEPDLPVEPHSVKPGHAVISTFDLFSIGGEHLLQYSLHDNLELLSSGPKQLTHCRPHARR